MTTEYTRTYIIHNSRAGVCQKKKEEKKKKKSRKCTFHPVHNVPSWFVLMWLIKRSKLSLVVCMVITWNKTFLSICSSENRATRITWGSYFHHCPLLISYATSCVCHTLIHNPQCVRNCEGHMWHLSGKQSVCYRLGWVANVSLGKAERKCVCVYVWVISTFSFWNRI